MCDYLMLKSKNWPAGIWVELRLQYKCSMTEEGLKRIFTCVQPADTASAAADQAAPVSCTKVPTFRNPYNGI